MRRLCPILLTLALALAGCAADQSRPPATPIRTATVVERRATFSILRRAWANRPIDVSDDHLWYERRLLDRAAYFGRRVRNTETYEAACDFWMACLREHISRYDDPHYRR